MTSGLIPDTNKQEMMLQMFVEVCKGSEPLQLGEDIKIMNNIKDDLLDALTAFCPDLPRQLSTQIESKVSTIRENIACLFELSDLSGFFDSYKVNVDAIATMLHPEKKEKGDFDKQKEDQIDDLANIRIKIQNYSNTFETIYQKIKEIGLEKMNIKRFHQIINIIASKNKEPVKWLEQGSPKKE